MAGPLVTYLALCVTPVVFFGVTAAILSPTDNRVKRFSGWAVQRVTGSFRQQVQPQSQDPFAVLSLQLRLERVAQEIADLERGELRSARAHHRRAAVAAYDDLLEDACRLAGVELPAGERQDVRRIRAEVQLRSLGWTW